MKPKGARFYGKVITISAVIFYYIYSRRKLIIIIVMMIVQVIMKLCTTTMTTTIRNDNEGDSSVGVKELGGLASVAEKAARERERESSDEEWRLRRN